MNKRNFALAIVALLIGIFLANFFQDQQEKKAREEAAQLANESMDLSNAAQGLAKGDRAPDFELTTLDDKAVKLSDYQGKKVILNFWATWCPPCKAEMPHMQSYYEENAEKENVEILAVNLTSMDDGEKAVQEFIDGYELTFPIPMDEKGEVGDEYRAFTIPTTYMIDTKGIIQHKIVGPMNEDMMGKMVEGME
ncbi:MULTISPECIES: peroxiredoxin family protein [Rossellomorea]|jgi:peroxiredoxin|uniref:peroxiredoxin family protein n=1 Tax=Rossellomorea TaxID=2837508 RepID=UPI0011E8ED3A|nr:MULTISPECIES: redoxin domain-containing protein [Rossellomorea]MDT9026434.1 redoxin domain-containing protein [Rossellomorea sp. YC4-1]TYS89272.1 redoxin domain-containing protein [Rossellomorea aquimaris]